jgi:hypothetical protein
MGSQGASENFFSVLMDDDGYKDQEDEPKPTSRWGEEDLDAGVTNITEEAPLNKNLVQHSYCEDIHRMSLP